MPVTVYKRHPSRQHAVFLSAVLLAAIITLFSLYGLGWLFILGFIFLGVYAFYAYSSIILLKGRDAILSLKPLKNRMWDIETVSGVIQGEILSNAFISRYVSIVSFQCESQRLHAMIFPDAFDQDDYRHWLIHFATQDGDDDFHQWPQT